MRKSSGGGPGAERRCMHQITKRSVNVENADAAIASRWICTMTIAFTDGDVAVSCGSVLVASAAHPSVQCAQDVEQGEMIGRDFGTLAASDETMAQNM